MESVTHISSLSPGDRVQGFYILSSASVKSGTNGRPYLAALLSDVTGSIEARMWDYDGPMGPGDSGRVVGVSGTVTEFRGALQLILGRLRLAGPHDAVDLSALVPTAPIDVEAAWAGVEQLVNSMEDTDYALICSLLLERCGQDLKTIPAAKSVHHRFLNGLLMHTYNMMRTADFLCGIYGSFLNRSLLLAGTLLHDMAKNREFLFSDLGLVSSYSTSGQLLGHLVMGAQYVADAARELNIPQEKSMLLQHLILAHHGQPEHGAAVVPRCAEAELLADLDLLDSRMEIVREALEQVPPGTFTERIAAMDRQFYRHH